VTDPVGHPVVLFVGPGRSGTSLLSGVLQQAVGHAPDEQIQGDANNELGFFEPRWLVEFHDRVLGTPPVTTEPGAAVMTDVEPAAVNELAAWLGEHRNPDGPTVVKDPRTVWALPLWQAAAAVAGVRLAFVLMLRPPAEFAGSMAEYGSKVDGSSLDREPDRAVHLQFFGLAWVNALLAAELATRGQPRVLISYEQLVDDWRSEVGRLDAELGTSFLTSADPATESAIDHFVRPDLRHARTTWDSLRVASPAAGLPDRVFDAFESARVGAAEARLPEAADLLRVEYDAAWQLALDLRFRETRQLMAAQARREILLTERATLEDRLSAVAHRRDELLEERKALISDRNDLRERLQQMRRDRNRLRALVASMESSASWRYTAPLRKIRGDGRGAASPSHNGELIDE
jgi:hypothetical protein